MLTVSSITCHKNQQIIFKDLGFTVGLGSCLLLVGHNGSGKTTLLKTIAGLHKPSSGEILWNEENVQDFYADFTSDVNYIGHKNFLKPKLTVLENLIFYAQLSDTEILIPSAVRYFRLEEILEKRVDQLSSGLKKRVMLAKLICSPKTIWLLDEPTINLDKQSKDLLIDLIETRVREGGIVIIATHDDIFIDVENKASKKILLEDFK